MSWLDTLLVRGHEARHVEPPYAPERVRPIARRPVAKHAPHTPEVPQVSALPANAEIKAVIITTRSPRDEGDPGACEIGHYSVVDGVVVMCSEDGKPTGKKQRIGSGEDPQRIASRLAKEAWVKTRGDADFNRPLSYPRAGIA
jgi:hypothetical protein